MNSANFSLLPIPRPAEPWTRGSCGLHGSGDVWTALLVTLCPTAPLEINSDLLLPKPGKSIPFAASGSGSSSQSPLLDLIGVPEEKLPQDLSTPFSILLRGKPEARPLPRDITLQKVFSSLGSDGK